ncbi:ParB/RepB/Spo0J family partition protein [Sphingomonas donggukensis]|uniref:ParB/RepB/Spo0J family partition protein n=1 Tax=Sphingomonas donggukensis TaxID=2949093 RepID=UPI003BF5AAFC
MTKTQMKVVLGSVRDIPFDKLVPSKSNVRRVKPGVSIEDLAEDIARRGLVSALAVRALRDDAGVDTGSFEVPAGGRRFQALQRLVKAKRLARTAPVPCIVKDGDSGISAEDDSLAENVHRVALHPLDQFRAFKVLADQGQGDEEIAANWFVTPAVVRQRLRLAAVSPTLLDGYAEDMLTLDQLMAFTVTTDHDRQLQVFERIQSGWNKEPYYIRSLLTQGAIDARDRRVRYLGIAAYEAAGGTVLRDLFTEDGDGWLDDALLLDRLALEKLQGEAAPVAAEGWRWVEIALDFPYGHQTGLRRLIALGSGLATDEEAQREALQAELEQLEADYADDPDDLPEAVDRRLSEIEAALDRLDSIPARFDDDDRARAGVFVSLGGDGRMRVERGFVRPEDEEAAGPPLEAGDGGGDGAGRSEGQESRGDPGEDDSSEDDAPKPLPERLVAELTAHRTLALRDAVAQVPEVALTLLLHKLVRDLFGSGVGVGGCLDVAARPTYLPVQAADLNDSASAQAIAARHAHWGDRLPVDDDDALWTLLATMADEERAALLAHCVGSAVNARWEKVDRYGGGSLSSLGLANRIAQADRLAQAVALDLAETGWRPTVANYLSQVTKPQIIAAVREGVGEMAAQLIDHLKKPDMAREAERLLAESNWVPGPLRTPDASPAEPPLPDFLVDADEDGSAPLAIAAE